MFHPSVSDGYDNGPIRTISRKQNLVDKTGNQINVIYPYKTKGGWSFDDAEVGLKGEPFVAGIPEIINSIVGRRRKFVAYISKAKIPNFTGHLRRDKNSEEAGWYLLQGTKMRGWLCPATLKYFKGYPDSIYFRIE